MTIFVYITDTCREQAKIHHINHALDKLAADIESEQAFWREQDIPHLMQRFYRHEQSADTQGTGLGLSIVQRIAELHEAKIEIYNRDEGGLAVEVWF